jgi:hypothetical protein
MSQAQQASNRSGSKMVAPGQQKKQWCECRKGIDGACKGSMLSLMVNGKIIAVL